LSADLAALAVDEVPFATPPPRADVKDAHWVEPSLVGEVGFSGWTGDGRLRHPTWRGLRPDKSPTEVVRES
jgi:bifunctional non-homologous end joining protein LigD